MDVRHSCSKPRSLRGPMAERGRCLDLLLAVPKRGSVCSSVVSSRLVYLLAEINLSLQPGGVLFSLRIEVYPNTNQRDLALLWSGTPRFSEERSVRTGLVGLSNFIGIMEVMLRALVNSLSASCYPIATSLWIKLMLTIPPSRPTLDNEHNKGA